MKRKKGKQEVIPATVVKAIDSLKSAVVRARDSVNAMLTATVEVYVACQLAKIKIAGKEVAKRTGASPAYISTVWRACEAAHVRVARLPDVADKLGYREFTRKYKPEPKKRKAAAEGITVKDILAQIEQVTDDIKEVASSVSEAERQLVLFALIDASEALREIKQEPKQIEALPKAA